MKKKKKKSRYHDLDSARGTASPSSTKTVIPVPTVLLPALGTKTAAPPSAAADPSLPPSLASRSRKADHNSASDSRFDVEDVGVRRKPGDGGGMLFPVREAPE